MRTYVYAVVLVVLLALCAAVVASAQQVTVEPPIPVTVEVTLQPTIGMTAQPTVEVTSASTTEATAQSGTQGTAQPTGQTTAQAPVQAESTTTPNDHSGYLRIAHFASGAPAVDVYVNGSLAVQKLTYPAMSQWMAVNPGSYTIAVVSSGQPINSTLFAPVAVSATGGSWQTIAVVGSATGGTLQGVPITEDYSDLLPSTGGFTFFNALEGSAPVNLVRNKVVYFAQIGFPGANTASSSSLRGDSGTFDVSAVDPNKPTTVFAENTALEMPENAYTFVALIGTQSKPQFFTLVTDRSAVEIARGLLPKPGTLIDALGANKNLTAFATALQSAGLGDLLTSSTQYTIFAPANFVLNNSTSSANTANILRGYIVAGKYTSKQLVDAKTLTALDGTQLKITTTNNGIFVNGVQLIDVNIAATNGVIHMLNGKLTAQ